MNGSQCVGVCESVYVCVCVFRSIDSNLADIFVCFYLFEQQLDTFFGKNCLTLAKRVASVSHCLLRKLAQVHLPKFIFKQSNFSGIAYRSIYRMKTFSICRDNK